MAETLKRLVHLLSLAQLYYLSNQLIFIYKQTWCKVRTLFEFTRFMNIFKVTRTCNYRHWCGRVWRRCVSYVTGTSNRYRLTVGQGLLSLWQGRVEGWFFLFPLSRSFLLSVPLLHLLYYLFYLFSLSPEDYTKWSRRVDVSLRIICRLTKHGGGICHLYTSS